MLSSKEKILDDHFVPKIHRIACKVFVRAKYYPFHLHISEAKLLNRG